MKILILTILTVFSFSAFAEIQETLVATCKMKPTQSTYWDIDKEIGLVSIYASDNGDEGFLKFVVSGPLKDDAGNNINLNGIIWDNTQDDGVAFEINGVSKLYTGIEGSDFNAAAVYLKNEGGAISGLIKLEFFTANLTSCVLK